MGVAVEKILALQGELADKTKRLAEIVDAAQGRDLSRRERAETEQIRKDVEALRARIPKFDPRQASPYLDAGGAVEGIDSPVLRPEQRVTDYLGERGLIDTRSGMWGEVLDPSRFSLGRMVRGMATGLWQGSETERRAMLEGSSSAGGAWLPTVMSSSLIDRLRNSMRVMQAGASTVVMEHQVLQMGRLTSGPSPSLAWHSEGAAITASDRTVDRITFTAQTLPNLTLISYELLNDLTDEAAAMIENEIVKSLALEVDRACLRGSGVAPEPCGVRNASGVTITSLGATGAQPYWDSIVDGVSVLRKANVEPSAIVWSARTQQSVDKFKTGIGTYMEPPPSVVEIPRLVSNQVPDNVGFANTSSEIYLGAWQYLMLGVRQNIGFELLTSTGPTMGGGRVRVLQERYADQGLAGLIAYFRGDVQLAHPNAFNVLTNVST